MVGAVYGALRLTGVPPLKQQVFLFFGAGQANIGAARLLVSALADEGLTEAQAKQQIWLYDSKASLYYSFLFPSTVSHLFMFANLHDITGSSVCTSLQTLHAACGQ